MFKRKLAISISIVISVRIMKIKMLVSARLANSNAKTTLHEGEICEAFHATNLPNWRERGKVFAFKKAWPFDSEILLIKGEYILV